MLAQVGKSFAEARRAFDDAVICGYVSEGEPGEGTSDGSAGGISLHVNPEDGTILHPDMRLIALAQTGASCSLLYCINQILD